MGNHGTSRDVLPMFAGRRSAWLAAALTLATGFGAVLGLHPLDAGQMRAWDDLGQAAATSAAAVGCWAAARRSLGAGAAAQTRAWVLMAIGVTGWTVGEVVWSWYELVARREVPFPSMADAGFLTFSAATIAALLSWQSRSAGGRTRTSAVLDGASIGTALLLCSWITSLGAAWRAGGETALAIVIATSYPVADVVLLALTILLLARAAVRDRTPLLLITLGIAAISLSDSFFVYATSTSTYASGALADVGWFTGFLLIAVAAFGTRPSPSGSDGDLTFSPLLASWPRLALPYVPTAIAGGFFFSRLISRQLPDPLITWCAVGIFALGSARQFLVLAENRRLLASVRAGHEQLRHQALHDSLTGLANRTLFTHRVEEALSAGLRDSQPRAVVYVDIDDFKQVNDRLGHAAGDQLLRDAAAKLRTCVRDTDTVARLGGDEFAILLHGGRHHAEDVAARIVAALRTTLAGTDPAVEISASVGVSLYPSEQLTDRPATEAFLAAADHAMYQAKEAGKNRYLLGRRSMPTPRTIPE